MNIKRFFPMHINLILKNIKHFLFQEKYEIDRNNNEIKFFYLDAASYNNIGDQAISLAIEVFLTDLFEQENLFVINESDLIKYLRHLKKYIKKNDVIILSGGGNMGNIYPRYESLRRLVIKTFSENRIIIFPQTIDYSNDNYGINEKKNSCIIYNKNTNLIVLAREKNSYIEMKNCYNNVILVPDIVFYLYNKIDISQIAIHDIGICLRQDKESIISQQQKKILKEFFIKNKYQFDELTTMLNDGHSILNRNERYLAVQEKINEFSKYKLIITDRLHGMIFSILAGVPCIAFDNNNHKVSGVYENIKERVSHVTVINFEKIEISKELIYNMMNSKCSFNIDGLFDDLKNIFYKI